MEDLTKTPLKDLTKEQFDTVYQTMSERYEGSSKWLAREQVLWIAMTFGQITPEKYNELF